MAVPVYVAALGAQTDALPRFGETEIVLEAWTPSGGAVRHMLPVPREAAGKHVRLEVVRDAGLRLDGRGLAGPRRVEEPRRGVEFDLTDLVTPGRQHELAAAEAVEGRLVIAPRVHIAGYRRARAGEPFAWQVSIRNTLENTANVVVRAERNGELVVEAVATVPPGVTQSVELRGEPPGDGEWRLLLRKDEEAMEGAYWFVLTVPGLLDGTRRKPGGY